MPPPWPRFGLPVVLRTIRGKLAALVVFSVLIAMGLAVWGMLLALRLIDTNMTATPGLRTAATLSDSGAVLAVAGRAPSPGDLRLGRTALDGGRVVYGSPRLVGKTALSTMAVPVYLHAASRPRGVQIGVFDLTALARSVAFRVGAGLGAPQVPVLVNPQGDILYDRHLQGLGRPVRNRRALAAFLARRGSGPVYVGEFYAPIAGDRLIGVFDPVLQTGFPLYILTGEAVPPVNRTLPLLLALAAVAVGAVALRLGGYRLTRPIQEAVAAARAYGQGNLSARIPPQRDAEFRDLVAAFNDAVAARSEGFRVEEALADSQEKLTQAQPEEAVLRVVGEGTCCILDARVVMVLTPDAEETLVPRAVRGEAAKFADGMRVRTRPGFPDAAFPCAVAYREGRFLSLNVDPPYPEGVDFNPMREQAAAYGLTRIMSFPLTYQGQSLGAMNCFLERREEASAAAREAVEALAMTATAALHGIALREETMLAMAASLEARDDETQEHALRVALSAERLAAPMGISDPEELQRLRWGALLHDVGKIGLPDGVLKKPGPLTREEWRLVHQHPLTGFELVRRLDFLGDARQIVLSHHERWDGHGYPQGLREEEIPLAARIFAVADSFDAITSNRPYRTARDYEAAREELDQGAGSQFDPRVVEAFLTISRTEWEELRRQAAAGSRFRRAYAAG